MPLKLTDINNPVSTNIVNTWADEKEITLNTHSTQISQLIYQFSDLLKKNPSLVKPNGAK